MTTASSRPAHDPRAGDAHTGDTHTGDTHTGDRHTGDPRAGDLRASDLPSPRPPAESAVAATETVAITDQAAGLKATNADADADAHTGTGTGTETGTGEGGAARRFVVDDRAGASALARARELRATERRRLLILVGGGTLTAAAFGLLVGGWRLCVIAGLWGACAALMWQRRTSEAHRWAMGAAGERRTARMLKPLTRHGYVVMHDRSIPGSRANLDHLVVGRAGVIVVDSKKWSGHRLIKGTGRYLRVGKVGGEQIVSRAVHERDRVRQVLEESLSRSVPVSAVLAVHSRRLAPWHQHGLQGVMLLPARTVQRWIRRHPARLTETEVTEVARACHSLFPPYGSKAR